MLLFSVEQHFCMWKEISCFFMFLFCFVFLNKDKAKYSFANDLSKLVIWFKTMKMCVERFLVICYCFSFIFNFRFQDWVKNMKKILLTRTHVQNATFENVHIRSMRPSKYHHSTKVFCFFFFVFVSSLLNISKSVGFHLYVHRINHHLSESRKRINHIFPG